MIGLYERILVRLEQLLQAYELGTLNEFRVLRLLADNAGEETAILLRAEHCELRTALFRLLELHLVVSEGILFSLSKAGCEWLDEIQRRLREDEHRLFGDEDLLDASLTLLGQAIQQPVRVLL